MNAYFSTSAESLSKNTRNIVFISEILKSLGVEVTHNWVERGVRALEKKKDLAKYLPKYENVNDALIECDVVILEASVETMDLGHQLASAVERKKPVLLLEYAISGEDRVHGFTLRGPEEFVTVARYDGPEALAR